jgi:branched-chain amino acid transport system substrate-binding protein
MKSNIFLLIVIILFVLIWSSYDQFFKNQGETLYIAFAGPMSGDGAAAGKLMSQAIELYLQEINETREKLLGKKIELKIFDDQNDCQGAAKQEAKRIVEENQVLAVIGHWYSSCSINAGKIYKTYGIPAITPGSVNVKVTQGNEWYFRNIYNASASGQFLAYYVNKVLKLTQVTIITDDSGYGTYLAEVFEQAALNLNMSITHYWKFQSNDPQLKQVIDKYIKQMLAHDKNTGAILLAVQANMGIPLVKAIKDAGIQNPILGGSAFSEETFLEGFKHFPKENANKGHYTNDIYVATPLLFDTANEIAQGFKDKYYARFKDKPDWSAAYAYDSAMVLLKAIREAKIQGKPETLIQDRQKIRDKLASYTNIHDALVGTTGFNYFNENRDAQKPVAIGIYKNAQLISALTQFQMVRNPHEIIDIEQAIKDERVLLINNNYMYKTNVVYSGVKFYEISDFDPKTLTYTLDFHLWFRFQGGASKPQEIEFLNALEPDKIAEQLKEPVNKKVQDQITYLVYRIKSRFRADFLSSRYLYKQHTLGFQFHHQYLTRNNLIYVTDVLGMGDNNEMIEYMRKAQILSPTEGWLIHRLLYFQNIVRKNSLGDPAYLNIQGGEVEYSQFNAGIEVKKNEFTLRGTIPYQYAANLLLLGIILILLFNLVGKKYRNFSKLIWFFQTMVAFILLLSSEVILLEWLSDQINTYNMKSVIRIFDILWWLIPAFLINLASESFIWTPLEEKTGRLIPNIVRLFLAFIIYFLAVVGIIAFVYEQQLTSILATSGVIAMIIGLAIQINISNIFSGIAINIERPFRIGDWVQIGKFEEGEIVDITWRTTRIKIRNECILSIPNSMASESPIINFNYPDEVYWMWPTVYIHPVHPPTRVKKILLDALLSAEKVLKDPAPVIIFTGINEWAASYWVAFCADNYADKNFILEDVWTRVWYHLNRAGITPAVQRQEIHVFKGIKERGGEEATKPITLLQEIDIFKPFPHEAKLLLSERIRRHRYQPGETVVQQGEAGDSLFIIVEGVVGIYVQMEDGKSKEVARLGAGNFFGEMALLTGEERAATVIAIVELYLFELTKEDIAPLINEQPEVSEMISKVLTQRQMATQSKIQIEEDTETEKEAVYKRFLNKIEQFFGLSDEDEKSVRR